MLNLRPSGHVETPTPTITPTPTYTPTSICPYPDQAGDTFAAATTLTAANAGIQYEHICPSGDTDWWKFMVSTNQTVRASLTDLPADYDLSLFSGVTPPGVWSRLNSDTAAPLFNRATMTRYPPGSTYKMVLALAALDSNIVSPSWRVNCTGVFYVGRKPFSDLHVHGSVNMVEAIKVSCNVYFYELMMRTGLDNWHRMGHAFGFGERTGVDLYEESAGLLPSTDYMNRRYGEKGWSSQDVGTVGWGAATLYDITRRRFYYDTAETITAAVKAKLRSDGSYRAGKDADEGLIISLTAEAALCLIETIREAQ